MTIFDEAKALNGMITMKKMTQAQIAQLLGTSQSYVANKLRLLKLTDEAQKRITELGLSERHARTLLRIKDEKTLLETIEKIGEMNLNVNLTEALVDGICNDSLPSLLDGESPSVGIHKFEQILKKSILSLRSLGLDVDYRTSFFGTTKYITIALMEN